MILGTASLLMLAACGGGGGGGGSDTATPPAPSNAAPTVQAGEDQTIEWPEATVQLTGSAMDDSSTTLTYSWSATSGPSGVTFDSATAAATSATFPEPGNYELTLSVSDGSATGTDVVAVTVSAAVYPASDIDNGDATDHGWTRVAAAADVGMTQSLLDQASAHALTGGGAGMIVRRGRLVHAWGNIDQRYDLKSTTKSIGGIALGLAIDDGLLALTDLAQTRLASIGDNPASNVTTGWLDDITILQLATHTAGFAKPGGYIALDHEPGTTWFYSDGGLNWLSELLTAVFNQDLATVLNTEVWTALGLNSSFGGPDGNSAAANADVHWRDNRLRPNSTPGVGTEKRELASGIFANANAMARVGLLFLRNGVWANNQRILSESFVTTVSMPSESIATAANPLEEEFPDATINYGVLWWTNAAGALPNVPQDAYWAWGLGDSLIVVIPSLDIVAVRAGPQAAANSSPGERIWNDDDWNGEYTVLAPFLDPIVEAVAP